MKIVVKDVRRDYTVGEFATYPIAEKALIKYNRSIMGPKCTLQLPKGEDSEVLLSFNKDPDHQINSSEYLVRLVP